MVNKSYLNDEKEKVVYIIKLIKTQHYKFESFKDFFVMNHNVYFFIVSQKITRYFTEIPSHLNKTANIHECSVTSKLSNSSNFLRIEEM